MTIIARRQYCNAFLLPAFDKQQTATEARGLSEKQKLLINVMFRLKLITFTKSKIGTWMLLKDVYT